MMNARTGLMVLSFALSVLIGLVLSRGHESTAASASQPSNHVLIGLSMDTLKEARWQRDRDMMLGRAAGQDAEILVQSANSDDARQIADIEGLLTRHVNVLIVIPHDGKAMA